MITEFFDVLDCAGRKTGQTIERHEAHRTGTWHGAFHCLILYAREGTGYALFQQRSSEKLIAPGAFDVSVGGHYTAGERAEAAGPREIREELGLDIPFDSLLPVGRRVFVYCFTPGVMEYEFQDVFLLPRSLDPGKLALQKEELDGIIEMDVEQGTALFSGKIDSLALSLLRPDGSRETIIVAADDFVPCLDNYYLKLLVLARRYFSGERDLLLI